MEATEILEAALRFKDFAAMLNELACALAEEAAANRQGVVPERTRALIDQGQLLWKQVERAQGDLEVVHWQIANRGGGSSQNG